MPALPAMSVYDGSMPGHSQIANNLASPNFRKRRNYSDGALPQNANMADGYDEDDKNGGVNHLRAWMRYRGLKGVDVAEQLGGNVTPGMVSDLVNSNRALSAKWLRRLAPIFDTTPGALLDYDPFEIDSDIIDMWTHADNGQRRQIVDLAKVVVRKTGTGGG